MYYKNFDLGSTITPIDYNKLEKMLIQAKYDVTKTRMLVDGFKNGFDLGYRGSEEIKLRSADLKFTIGSRTILWNKVMKEVKEKRYAGPFKEIPFEHFIQSPIGLVPKDGGTKTRLIFHLSHPRKNGTSVNANTPEEMKTVHYKDFDEALKLCLKLSKQSRNTDELAAGKSDLSSAFRHLPIAKKIWKFLVMKAQSPFDGRFYYFIDKCLPFGAAISCAHFQAFSDALAHIIQYRTSHENVNYLDDFLFLALLTQVCNWQIEIFLDVCRQIRFPVSLEKTGRRKL